MKTNVLILLSITLLWASSFPALVVDPDPAGLNVRSGPGGTVTGSLPSGDYAIVLNIDTVIGNWARYNSVEAFTYENGTPVELAGDVQSSGYVYRKLIKICQQSDDSYDNYGFVIVVAMDGDGVSIVWGEGENQTINYSDIVYPLPREGALRDDARGRTVITPRTTIITYTAPILGSDSKSWQIPSDIRAYLLYITGVENNFLRYSEYWGNTRTNSSDATFHSFPAQGYIRSESIKGFEWDGERNDNFEQVFRVPGIPLGKIEIDNENCRVIDAWRDWLKIEVNGNYYWVSGWFYTC